MAEIPLLATTALEDTWGEDENLVFLGEWCRLYDRRDAWRRRSHTVVPNHWNDRSKLRRDNDYLDSLHESLLEDLASVLNRYHGMDRPVRYWRMVLDPWLLTYVAVIFNRWECLRVAGETHCEMTSVALRDLDYQAPSTDCFGFIEDAAFSSAWNYRTCLRILRSVHARLRVNLIEVAGPQPSTTSNEGSSARRPEDALSSRKRLLLAVAKAVDFGISKFTRRNKVVFYASYFRVPALVRLNLALRQIPRMYLNEFEYPRRKHGMRALPVETSGRSALCLAREDRTGFEAFIADQLVHDMPVAYVEEFPSLLDRARSLRMTPRIICSANAHWGNEAFKVWAAEQVMSGAKYFALEHGGSFPPLFDSMSFEEKISDRKIVWGRPYHANQVSLPANKLVTRSFASTGEYCSVIGQESPLFPYRATAGPIAEQTLTCHSMVCDLYFLLDARVQRAFRVKPYPDSGWNTRQRYIDRLGADKVFERSHYYGVLAQSRLVICTYPNTTYSEAIVTELPTLLVYPLELWETVPEMDALLDVLRSARLVFHDAGAAATHVNSIWDDLDRWWSSAQVVQARAEFRVQALNMDSDWVERWSKFLAGACS